MFCSQDLNGSGRDGLGKRSRPKRLLLPVPGMASERLMSMKEEIRNFHFWKAVRCEFLVTLLYVFIGCGSTTVWPEPETVTEVQTSAPHDVKVALSFGLAVATLVQCVGHISGAHLNPAVTMAMLVTRNVTVLRAVCYIIAQCVGGIAGAGILYGVTPVVVHGNLGVTQVHSEMGLGQAFGVEFMITFIVVFTVFANLEPKRIDMGSRSLAIGLAVMLGHLFAAADINTITCRSKSSPQVVVVNSEDSENMTAILLGDNARVTISNLPLRQILLDLVGAYYAWDLSYPTQYQLLAFLQVHFVKDITNKVFRGSGLSLLEQKYLHD